MAGKRVIGVLGLQGAFKEHMECLESLDIQSKLIKSKKDMEGIDGIILPGGESTVMGKMLIDFKMIEFLSSKIRAGLPAWGTCAGMILLANRIDGINGAHLGVMDIDVKRNAYGRQIGSFITSQLIPVISNNPIPLVFIRAPYINSVGSNVRVLCKVDGNIVAAREGNMLATSFHPELTEDMSFHRYFIDMVS